MGSLNRDIRADTPVQFLKGVGPRRAKIFSRLGVENVRELLDYFPRDWVFIPEAVCIGELREDMTATVTGIVEQAEYQGYRRRGGVFRAKVRDETGILRIVWFNGGFLRGRLEPGDYVTATGKVARYKGRLQMANPKFDISETAEEAEPGKLSGPVYPASEGLSSANIKNVVRQGLCGVERFVPELFDNGYLKERELAGRAEAYRLIHQPGDEADVELAKRRLKYDEFFLMQLGLAIKRYINGHYNTAKRLECTAKIDERIRRRFPFELTADQDKVIEEIKADVAGDRPANRLIQGDVGSGKTVVALYAALLAVANKSQAVIMAPTEILARQHYDKIRRYLKGSRVRFALVTGAMRKKERAELLVRIKGGEVDIVVGTVALIEEDVEFAELGLAVIDEQHKFGVHQRAGLKKGHCPHTLVMTATPIPRTLAMTVFGDLDVSVIRHSPPGRGEVVTRLVNPADRGKAYEFIREILRNGRQAYFVYPAVENDGERGEIKAAVDEHKRLSGEVFGEFGVELVHGRMTGKDKNAAMERFRRGEAAVLVSTIVIEVGMDVPNAVVMVIEHAERFGLAQLHQLRGRIGRGQNKSYCFLFSESTTEAAKHRLEVLTRTTDGFEISEQDLVIRGPGELFSARQHGLPDLKIANIVEDMELLGMARRDALELVKEDPRLSKAGRENIKKELLKKFGETLKLVDIA